MRPFFAYILLIALLTGVSAPSSSAAEGEAAPVDTGYQNDFQTLEPGKPPKEFLILQGEFKVIEEEGNKLLELPGEPLEDYGLLFAKSSRASQAVSARFKSENVRRTFPTFAVGLFGVSGFKLQVSPAKRALEILRGGEVRGSVEYQWQSGAWTHLKLEATKSGEAEWTLSGKAWIEGQEEPAEAMVSVKDAKQPPSGRPSIWGTPFSGKRILFDDLRLSPVESR